MTPSSGSYHKTFGRDVRDGEEGRSGPSWFGAGVKDSLGAESSES